MSEEAAEPPPPFLSRLAAVYLSPSEAMRSIARAPTFWAPLLAFVALGAAFNAVWLHHLDPLEFARVQIEDSPFAERMSAADRAAGIAQQAKVFPYVAWLGPLLFSPLSVLLVALLYLSVFRFFYGAEVTLKQSLSVAAWTFLAVALLALPLTLLVLYLKQDWNVDPRTSLQANPTILLDQASVPRALYSIAESLDLFTAWGLELLSVGYGAAAATPARRAAIGVVALWSVYVLGKAALAAVF